MVTAKDYYQLVYESLAKQYPSEERRAIAFFLLQKCYAISTNDVLTQKPIHHQIHNSLKKHIIKLQNHQPVQYVVGEVDFCGLPIKVNPSVLIPRPETEELAYTIIKSEKNGASQFWLDIGTGSGCIALALKHLANEWQLTGVDVSLKAVITARRNAKLLNLEVGFKQRNIFNSNFDFLEENSLDGLVSNPPYIPVKDSSDMAKHVVNYEPATALYVPNDNPLIFYKKIAAFGKRYLKPGAKLYFEIYEHFGHEIEQLLKELNYKSVSTFLDFNNKVRFAVATNA